MQFPPPPTTISHPLKVIPQHPKSMLTLRFTTESGQRAEIEIPLRKLIRYGAPLYTTLWLGFALDAKGSSCDFMDAFTNSQNPEMAKVALTLFRPCWDQDYHGLAVNPEPDIRTTLAEDMDCCTGPTMAGPTASSQIRGLMRALRILSITTQTLQEAVFSPDRGINPELTKQLQDTLLALSPDPAVASDGRILELQDLVEKGRQENARLQLLYSELQQRNCLQGDLWKKQLESKDAELQAVRREDGFRSTALDQAHQEVSELQRRRDNVESANQLLEGSRKALSNDHAEVKDELTRLQEELSRTQEELSGTQASLAGAEKELIQARASLSTLPTLEEHVGHLEVDLKLARENAEALFAENLENQQELSRARARVESMQLEKESMTKRLDDQLARGDELLEALRIHDQDRVSQDDELATLRLETSVLRQERQQLTEDKDRHCKRWSAEVEGLRAAKEQLCKLQKELAQKSTELEVMRVSHNHSRTRQEAMFAKTLEDEARNKAEDGALKEALSRLKSAAPQRLKDLREECEDLRKKDEERVQLNEQLTKALAELDIWRGKYGDVPEA